MNPLKLVSYSLALAAALFSISAPAQASFSGHSNATHSSQRLSGSHKMEFHDYATCARPTVGHVGCLAIRRTAFVNGIRQHALAPMTGTSFGANALRHAYGITSVGARYKVIAIVDAAHSASAYDDLTAYRRMYALPDIANCGNDGETLTELPAGKDSCFVQVNQDGVVDHSTKTTDGGWAQEIALDIEMAGAVCPHCSILLVEAGSSSFADLNSAVATAAGFKGVTAISNSYGGPDVPEGKQPAYADAAAKGIAVVASSGDAGYGVSAPASFPSVVGVGGTSLVTDATYRWASESAWSRGGSGCSALNARPVWQDAAITDCTGKSIVDVAAVADPATGVAVAFEGQWYSFGGTSAAAPIIAALFGMKANYGANAGAYLWANRSLLHDVISGTNGRCLTALYCTSGVGFDGPTGWGTPQGAGAF
jgi:subtilase family serine protease